MKHIKIFLAGLISLILIVGFFSLLFVYFETVLKLIVIIITICAIIAAIYLLGKLVINMFD